MYYILQSLLILIMLSITSQITIKSLLKIIKKIKIGNEYFINKRYKERIKLVLNMVLMGGKIMDIKSYGIMHYFYFYGFIILGLGHMELLINGLTKFLEAFKMQSFLYQNYLSEFSTKIYDLSQDLMAFSIIIVVGIALYNRISGKVKRLLPRSKDAEMILWFIAALYSTYFLFTTMNIILSILSNKIESNWYWNFPISSILALMLNNLSYRIVNIFYFIGWWSHLILFLGFAIYIPRSKHLHLILAIPNIFLSKLDEFRRPEIMDFEKELVFGVDKINQFSWKTLLDSFSCSECGRCNEVCPAANTNKSLAPKKILHDIKINISENWMIYDSILKESNKKKTELELIGSSQEKTKEGQISLDEIWECTTCGACAEVCPILIDSVPTSLINIRRYLVMMNGEGYPKEINSTFKGLENQGNPWGIGLDKRNDWMRKIEVEIYDEKNKAEYLFWVGCAGSTDNRSQKTQRAFVSILNKFKINFATLGTKEKCCGDPARRLGNEYLYDILVRENIEKFNELGIKKIITCCPHCLNQLKNEYRDFGTNFAVYHHSEFILDLMEKHTNKFDVKSNKKITFHDPCYLGRYNKIYNEPRKLIFKGYSNYSEMLFSKRRSFCCGAGGGRMFMEENSGSRVNIERINQVKEIKAEVLVTSCPFCITMLGDAIKDTGSENEIEIKDIAELIAERI